MKNHKINFFFNKVEEKKITEEELIPLLRFKKIYIYWSLHCFYNVHNQPHKFGDKLLSFEFKLKLLER